MFQIRTMITNCLVTAHLATGAPALEDLELKAFESEGDPRLFFANFTSSLVQGGIL